MDTTIARRKPLLSNSVFGMMIFVLSEIMFFVALISAFIVIKRDRIVWDIPEHIKLPVETTFFNTLVLLTSGVLLFLSGKKLKAGDTSGSRSLLLTSLLLAAFFLIFQGYEWVQLMSYGLSMKTSIFGALFFLLIGCHALHAFVGGIALSRNLWKSHKGTLTLEGFYAAEIFWFLVVGIWPVLFLTVYF